MEVTGACLRRTVEVPGLLIEGCAWGTRELNIFFAEQSLNHTIDLLLGCRLAVSVNA